MVRVRVEGARCALYEVCRMAVEAGGRRAVRAVS